MQATAVTIGVAVRDLDAAVERTRLARQGLLVTDVQHIDDDVDYFELTDPDANTIGFVTGLG